MKDFVTVDEIANKISESEYTVLLEKLKKKGYDNDPLTGESGNIINTNDLILQGIEMISKSGVVLI